MSFWERDRKHGQIIADFVKKCVDLCWHFVILADQLVLRDATPTVEEPSTFSAVFHERHSTSNLGSDEIKECFWPAIVKANNLRECVFKAIVVTQ